MNRYDYEDEKDTMLWKAFVKFILSIVAVGVTIALYKIFTS